MQPIYEFGGAGSVLHFALANGFAPQTYKPLLDPLTDRYRVITLPPRALWDGETPPAKAITWKAFVAQDLIQGLRDYDLRDVIGVGHSFGGVATLLASIVEPQRFKAIVLLDPTILPPSIMRAVQLARIFRASFVNGMAKRAESRRNQFESVEEAYAYFREKRLFADWSDEAVRLYAETLKPMDTGAYTLGWAREWEAFYFRTFYAGTWGDIGKVSRDIPILAVRGGKSDTFYPKAAEILQRKLPHMDYAVVAGHGHLFPQSAPDETRTIIADWLDKL
jgi:pimeloyl-ACP methyl ester carboxylesterase